MKKIFICIILLVISVLVFSQTEKPGVIERNERGTISSVKFSSEKEESPRSAIDFFERYLGTSGDDSFEKVPHKSKKKQVLSPPIATSLPRYAFTARPRDYEKQF